ncbi:MULTISPECIES: cobalt transporter CbiM [unclassified Moorena]|uniref:cobalt transporter CbiM n=1 Tax=unclassified Moorena TaxID=2683338 RepID=UPI0013BC915A|nr:MULTISPECIES: cobalt transporter CbiM [unclassified Moorena]NEQ12391.1 cobalt transporter CbiM [Moorena sp. SIO3E2]NER86952.1 cobalt transporter CbiM [Moorena sp. SIO3A2]NES46701.1 cobalt transporter CbiM [Moorena sp. SIO2C4]NES87089.1 cobalt transporter CbiM [Moorena sp. SIO2B7]
MHIPDGILPASVCLAGYAATGGLTWYALRRIDQHKNPQEAIPRASLLTAAFFVASSIHLPIPPASVHFVLNGLLGAILGYYAVPAILIGLFFQAVMFQHGGLSTLGINAAMMGVSAILAYHLFQLRRVFGKGNRIVTAIFSFLAGAAGLGVATLIFFVLVITNIPANFNVAAERTAIYGLMVAHIPLMVIEGSFSAAVVLFLQRVQPELLGESGRGSKYDIKSQK